MEHLNKWTLLLAPPVLAVLIIPEDGNFWTHLMVYTLGFFGAVFSLYELGKKD